jgi:sec-independent protein translocase protein TatA
MDSEGCRERAAGLADGYPSPMFNGSIGVAELALVLVVVLLIFGPKRLPSLGRQLGRGMREFKDSITGDSRRGEDELEDETGLPPLNSPSETKAEAPARDAEQPRA